MLALEIFLNPVINCRTATYSLTQPLTTLQIPTTVQGVLFARIDRLAADEKNLLQQLSVIGREFSLGLIRAGIPQPEEEQYRLLSALQHKEFLYEQPAFPEVEYLFKHALTQEVAYNSVLIERRKALHEQTGHAIEQLYHERVEEHSDALAHHYQRSGNADKAVTYLYNAGQRTVQRSAHADAVMLFTTALELLPLLPAGTDRTHRELTLHLALGVTRQATDGFGSPAVGQAYERAYALCHEIGDVPERFLILRGLCVYHNMQANFHKGYVLAEQLLAVAEQEGHTGSRIEAHLAMGANIYWQGDFTGARAQFEAALALYDPTPHRNHTLVYGRDSRVFALEYCARTEWSLGYPDQALRRTQDMVTWAQELGHTHTLVWALTDSLWVPLYRREWQAAHEQVEAAFALATDHGFSVWIAIGRVIRGWLLVQQGQLEAGLRDVQQGLANIYTTGVLAFASFAHVALIEAYLAAGQYEMSLRVVTDALQFADLHDNRFLETEIHRLKGELLRAQDSKGQGTKSREGDAEACFLKAIEIAQKQHAKSLELRASTSLARLWQQQGKKQDAYEMLTAIYQWFTEGFDTKDLQEAQGLLEELRERTS